jgi:hypothetical protein
MSSRSALARAGDLPDMALRALQGHAWVARKVRNNNLRQHVKLLLRAPYRLSGAHFRALSLLVAQRTRLLLDTHPRLFPLVPVLLRLAAYQPQWKRDPHQWQPALEAEPREHLVSLIRHLFELFPSRHIGPEVWWLPGSLEMVERDWYCHLVSGGSRRTAPGMPPSVSARTWEWLSLAPEHLPLLKALRWAQLQRLRCPEPLMAAVLGSRAVEAVGNDRLWNRLAEKAIATPQFEPEQWGLLSETLYYLVTRVSPQRADQMLDLPMADLLRFSAKLVCELAQTLLEDGFAVDPRKPQTGQYCKRIFALSQPQWGSILPETASAVRQEGAVEYVFQEITSSDRLAHEGRLLRHCVASYRSRCARGDTTIVSLRRGLATERVKTSLLTLEIQRRTRRIVQIKGRSNRRPEEAELEVVRAWATENGLRL